MVLLPCLLNCLGFFLNVSTKIFLKQEKKSKHNYYLRAMEFKYVLKENLYFPLILKVLSCPFTDITATLTKMNNEVYLLWSIYG